MKKKSAVKTAFANVRLLLGISLCLAGITIVLLALGKVSAQPGTASIQANPPATGFAAAANKIAPEVMTDTADGKSASVIIFMADQADVSAASDMADQDARGWFVYKTLVSHAERTQSELRTFLDSRGIAYQSFWAANMLVATLNRTLVEGIAARSDVARVDSCHSRHLNPGIPIPFPLSAYSDSTVHRDAGIHPVIDDPIWSAAG